MSMKGKYQEEDILHVDQTVSRKYWLDLSPYLDYSPYLILESASVRVSKDI